MQSNASDISDATTTLTAKRKLSSTSSGFNYERFSKIDDSDLKIEKDGAGKSVCLYGLTPSFNYYEARQSAMRHYPKKFSKHFRGGFGLPGGIDISLAYISKSSLSYVSKMITPEQLATHKPDLVPHFKHLKRYIQSSGMHANATVIALMERALKEKKVTFQRYRKALLCGICRPEVVTPETRDLMNHASVRAGFKNFLSMNPSEIAKELIADDQYSDDRIDDRIMESTLLKPYYFNEAFYFSKNFDEKLFGIMTAVEAFYDRFAIIGVSQKPYQAHGVSMDPYSAVMHDYSHMTTSHDLETRLLNTLRGLYAQHLAKCGTLESFKEAKAETYLGNEQTRFLTMMKRLNQEAFRCWGGTQAYDNYALGQFLLIHEIVSFDDGMILSSDFVRTLQRYIRRHNDEFQKSVSWESYKDLLETDPITGKSCLPEEEIVKRMLEKNMSEVEELIDKTSEIEIIKSEIRGYEEEIPSLAAQNGEITPIGDKVTPMASVVNITERLGLECKKLAATKKAYQMAISRQFKSTKIRNNVGNFYDLKINLNNGKILRVSEPTLRFKAKNFADTKGLLKIAGINLPDMPTEGSHDKETKHAAENTTERTYVQATLRQGVREWQRVMTQFAARASLLAQKVIDPATGRSLADEFFYGRFAGQTKMKAVLAATRVPGSVVGSDNRPERLKRKFKGW